MKNLLRKVPWSSEIEARSVSVSLSNSFLKYTLPHSHTLLPTMSLEMSLDLLLNPEDSLNLMMEPLCELPADPTQPPPRPTMIANSKAYLAHVVKSLKSRDQDAMDAVYKDLCDSWGRRQTTTHAAVAFEWMVAIAVAGGYAPIVVSSLLFWYNQLCNLSRTGGKVHSLRIRMGLGWLMNYEPETLVPETVPEKHRAAATLPREGLQRIMSAPYSFAPRLVEADVLPLLTGRVWVGARHISRRVKFQSRPTAEEREAEANKVAAEKERLVEEERLEAAEVEQKRVASEKLAQEERDAVAEALEWLKAEEEEAEQARQAAITEAARQRQKDLVLQSKRRVADRQKYLVARAERVKALKADARVQARLRSQKEEQARLVREAAAAKQVRREQCEAERVARRKRDREEWFAQRKLDDAKRRRRY